MSKHCVFNEQWLDEQLNPEFSCWIAAVNGNKESAFCKVCSKTFKLSNMGRRAVSSHGNGPNHLKNIRAKMSQPSLASFTSCVKKNSLCSNELLPSTSSGNVESVLLENTKSNDSNTYVVKDDVTKAEIIWAMEVLSKRMSLNSCIQINKTFQLMFPDSAIASKFTLGKSKASYVINHGLAPHFKECLMKDLKQCTDFVICFDESLNKIAQRGQMDQFVRYWDIALHKVSTRYLSSVFLGRATANDLLEKFIEGAPLPLDNMLQVSMDGPNVNLSFLQKLKDKLRAENPDGKLLVEIGVCGLHVVNGAMKTGLQAVKWDIHHFLRSLYYLLKDSPARRANYSMITGCKDFPLKFCTVRWLENVNCLTRALLVYDHINKYVQKSSASSKQHMFLAEFMKSPLLKCKLAAFKTIASECESFLRRFQSQKPLIPFLHTDLLDLMKNLMARSVKPDKLSEADSVSKLLALDVSKSENLISVEKVDIGLSAKKLLKEVKCPEREKLQFKFEFRKLVTSMIEKLRAKSPLKFKFVRGVTCLDPNIIVQQPSLGKKRVEIVLEVLLSANRISDDCAEKANKQYASLCIEAQSAFKSQFHEFLDSHNDSIGLDKFYSALLDKQKKFVELWDIIKICLIMSHGNASVEGGFSVNKSLLVENLLEESLICQRTVFDAIKNVGGVEHIAINRRLLLSVRASRQRYQDYFEEKSVLRDKEEKKLKEKRKIDHEIKELKEKRQRVRKERELEEEALQVKISDWEKKKNNV